MVVQYARQTYYRGPAFLRAETIAIEIILTHTNLKIQKYHTMEII